MTDNIAGHSKGVNLAGINDRGGRGQLPRYGGLAFLVHEVGILRIGNVGRIVPKEHAGPLVKAEEAFLRLGQRALAIGQIDSTFGYHGAGITPPNPRLPADRQSVGRKSFQDTCLVPHTIPVRSPPLWPIVGSNRGARKLKENKWKNSRHVILASGRTKSTSVKA